MTTARNLLGALVGLAALVSLAGAARADERDIRLEDNAASLSLGMSDLDYKETGGAAVLDSEKGWMPLLHLEAGLLANPNAKPLLRNLYLHVSADATLGDTKYDGALCDQFGTCTPAQDHTHDRIYGLSMQAGRGFSLGGQAMAIPYADLGARYWQRALQGPGGYTEDYHHYDAMAGLKLQYSPVPRLVASLSGAMGRTFGAAMDTWGETFTLGDAMTWQSSARLGYRLSPHVELQGTAQYLHFRYGASGVDSAGYYEPNSTTQQLNLLVGLSYQFF